MIPTSSVLCKLYCKTLRRISNGKLESKRVRLLHSSQISPLRALSKVLDNETLVWTLTLQDGLDPFVCEDIEGYNTLLAGVASLTNKKVHHL